MIVKVTNDTISIMYQYIKKNPTINLFIIGDVEQFGLYQDFQEVFLQFDNGDITSCILRFYKNIVIYSEAINFNVDEVKRLLACYDLKQIQGSKKIIDFMLPYFNEYKKVEECFYCELNSSTHLNKRYKYDIKEAREPDVERIYPLMDVVGFHSDTFIESTKKKIKNKASRLYYIEENDLVLSSAATTIETSVSAMIGSVATDPNHRKKGLATEVVSKLCMDLINENKKPCLFYDNEEAGNIYQYLGFENIDKWSTIICEEKDYDKKSDK